MATDPLKNIQDLNSLTGLRKLVGIVNTLDDKGRKILLDSLNKQLSDSKKSQILALIRSEAVKTDAEIRNWLVQGISKSYVSGMNQAQTIGLINVGDADALPVFKWVGGTKGDLTEQVNKTFGQPTVGEGIYFSLDPNSSSDFGDNLKSYLLPKKLNLYDSTGGALSTRNVTSQLADNPLYRKMLQAGETDFNAFAKKSGYDGVIFFSDDGKHKWVAVDEKVALKAVKETVAPTLKVTVELLKTSNVFKPHLQAVNALLSDAYLDFGNAMNGYVRGAEKLLNDALKRQIRSEIAFGRLEGSSISDIKKIVKETIGDRGFNVLIDKGGRQWSLGNYSEMLARTHINKANNEAAINRTREFGVDIVEISNSGATDEACTSEEGKIYSISGESQNYDSLDGHEPPYHPNCTHNLIPRPDLS